jgi:hypothetical protein
MDNAPDNSADASAPETLVITGLPGGDVTVSGKDDVVTVVKADAPADASAAAGGAAPAADSPDKPVADALGADDSAKSGDAPPADKPAEGAADEKPDNAPAAEEESDGDADAEDEEDSDGEDDDESEKGHEEKEGDDKEKPDGKEPAEEREPSEVEKAIETLGGLEVVESVRPLLEVVNNPDATGAERYAALKQFLPADQLFEVNNDLFWDAVQNPSIQKVLVEDPETREIYAQGAYGVPSIWLDRIVAEQKELYTAEEMVEYASAAKAAEGDDTEKPEPAKVAPKAEAKPAPKKPDAKVEEKKEEKKEPEKKPDAATVPEALMPVLDTLNEAVEGVVQSHKLEGAQVAEFEAGWSKAFTADRAAVEAYAKVKGFAEKGKQPPPALALALVNHSKRIAADVAQKLAAPKVEKAKAAEARADKSKKVRKETPGAKAAAASSVKGGATEAPAVTGIAARFPGGVIPDPNSDEFARYLEAEFQRKLGGSSE